MGIDAVMYVALKRKVTDKEIQRLSYDLGSAFGPDAFFLDREGKYHNHIPRHAVTRADQMKQDGDEIPAIPGTTYLKVHIWTRYYGEGYERGDLPFLLMLGAYLEKKLPDCEVWYGGDSSGVLLRRFNAAYRGQLFNHFVHEDNDNYGKGFHSVAGDGLARHCDFCDEPMTRNGFGAKSAAFYCPGCGFREETNDGGVTWEPREATL